MAKELIQLGPFADGIQLGGAPAADNLKQAADIVNFDILSDGTLRTRQTTKMVKGGMHTTAKYFEPIGHYDRWNDDIWLVARSDDGTYAVNMSQPMASFNKISSSKGTIALQYDTWLWIVSDSGPSGRWNPENPFQAVTGMPQGVSAVIHRDRLLIARGDENATLWYSKTLDFTGWNVNDGAGNFLVNRGDGEELTCLLNFNDQVAIFKQRSTYLLNFMENPATGHLTLMSRTIGATNRHCAKVRGNSIVLYYSGKVYLLDTAGAAVISDAIGLNIEKPEGLTSNINLSGALYKAFVSFIDDSRILVYAEGFYWVYHLTGTEDSPGAWTRYEFYETLGYSFDIGPLYSLPVKGSTVNDVVFSSLKPQTDWPILYQFSDIDEDHTEVKIFAYLLTRVYNFNTPMSFKRLHHWGVDILGLGTLRGTVIPVTKRKNIVWNDIQNFTWTNTGQFTWANLGEMMLLNQDTVTLNIFERTFIRFLKSMRFRQIQFRVEYDYQPEVNNELFALTTVVSGKQLVPAKVN